MVKRVSVKGKGAEIFFGENALTTPATETPQEVAGETAPLVAPEGLAQTDRVDKQEGLQESKKESKEARKQASSVPGDPAQSPLASEILSSIWKDVAERATITNAFRYTDQELTALTDALYEVTKRHGVKLTKQDVARLGLNAVLWDYKVRGDASLLGQLVIRRKRQLRES